MRKNYTQYGMGIIFLLGVFTGVAMMALQRQHPSPDHAAITETTTDEQVNVSKVIDGDTIIIDGGEHVRLLGIDTPERGERYYREATERLRALVGGRRIRMQKDVSERDRYGRLLRHIYVGDLWVNEQMIASGYARFVTFPPDVAHVDIFRAREKEAREARRGLWQ